MVTRAISTRSAAAVETEERSVKRIEIESLQAETMRVPIIGYSPLIIHRFGQKAKQQMLDRSMGEATAGAKKVPKNPQAEYLDSLYYIARDKKKGVGFPVTGFKAATVSAARYYGTTITMTALRQFLFFRGIRGVDGIDLSPIYGEHEMREDAVRINKGMTSDIRYRAMFPEWTSHLDITYVSGCISRASVLALVNAGGMGVGVGDWRIEKGGTFGTYGVDTSRDIEIFTGAAAVTVTKRAPRKR